jgi:hypothetical protein
MSKKVTCKICFLQEHTDNKDLNSNVHEGFTVGTKGKIMYWMMVWHGTSGNVTVYPISDNHPPRYLSGDQLITIHWKQNQPTS